MKEVFGNLNKFCPTEMYINYVVVLVQGSILQVLYIMELDLEKAGNRYYPLISTPFFSKYHPNSSTN